MATRIDTLKAAIATNARYAANYVKAHKDPAKYLAKIAGLRAELDVLEFPVYPVPPINPSFEDTPSANIEPGELPFTDATARQWWDYVTAHPVDYSKVASGYLPGRHVLSLEETRFWQTFEEPRNAGEPGGMPAGTLVAPHFWNPLGIVPNP
jgi:hypothetical protein